MMNEGDPIDAGDLNRLIRDNPDRDEARAIYKALRAQVSLPQASGKIYTMRTRFGLGLADFIEHHHGERERNPRLYHKRFEIPTETLDDSFVEAVVDHERLIVCCPFCPTGAEIVDTTDLRYFCLQCFNAEVGGKFVRVILPESFKEGSS